MIGRASLRRVCASLGRHTTLQNSAQGSVMPPTVKHLRDEKCEISVRSFQTSSCLRFADEAKVDIKTRIEGLVGKADVVVFMKGVPEAPRCGFSNAVCQILRMHDVPFESHDVLSDEVLRQGVKDFSNWPTIPQVYFKSEFIGGCDIMLQMHQSGELVEELEKIGIKSALLNAEQDDKK